MNHTHAAFALAAGLMLTPWVLAEEALQPPTTQPQVEFKTVETPYPVEVSEQEAILMESLKYVAVLRAELPAGERAVGLLAHLVQDTPKEALPSEEIRSFLETQDGRAIRITPISGPEPLRPSGLDERGAGPVPSPRLAPQPYGPTHGGTVVPFRRPVLPSPQVYLPAPAWPEQERLYQIVVLAPSEQRARQLVRAMIVAYDYGWSYAERRRWLDSAKAEEDRLPPLRAELEKAKKALEEVQAKMDKLPDIVPEALAALRSEKWMLEVKQSGVQARAEAAQKLLAKPQTEGQMDQLRAILILAQIDLGEVLARREKVEQLIQLGTQRQRLLPERDRAQKAVTGRADELMALERQVAACRQAAEDKMYAPLRPLGEVKIHPVKLVKVQVPGPGIPSGYPIPRSYGPPMGDPLRPTLPGQ